MEDKTEKTALETEQHDIRPDVLNVDDVIGMVPKLKGHEKLVKRLLHWLKVDKVNQVHANCCDTPGPEFVKRLLFEEFKVKLRIDNEQVLNNLPEGAFITVSNHPFGALDGITLIYLISSRRPQFKVMVNMILNKISAMRPNFIAVDAWASKDPKMKNVSINGIRQALYQIRRGEPVGFFPAGAMSNVNWKRQPIDRPWQKSILQIIQRSKVPVIPIFFHGNNSWIFDVLGHVCWQARSLRLPIEVFKKCGKEIHVSIGNPISVEEQMQHGGDVSAEELGKYLREKTYELRDLYK